MKADRVMAWLLEENPPSGTCAGSSGSFPHPAEITRVPTAELVADRLGFDPYDVLCIVDAAPYFRTRRFLEITDNMPGRPVVVVVAPSIDVPTAVQMMEQGAFTVVAGEAGPERLSAAVGRALENRRAFQKILNMSRSLERSKTSLEQKRMDLSAEKIKFRRKVSEVMVMRRVAEWIGRCRTLEEGLSVVLANLCDFLGAASGTFLVSPVKDRWLECGAGAPEEGRRLLPRKENRFLRAASIVLFPDTMRMAFPQEEAATPPNAVAFPVRIRRRFLGYGLLWGPDLPPPSPDTLRLLEAVGVQLGVFCQKVSLQEQVETDRDRLAQANEELNFLFRLATALHEDPDMDSVFEWLCREIHRFVPCSGLDLVSLVGNPVVRTSGLPPVPGDGENAVAPSRAAAWTGYLLSRHRVVADADDLAVRIFPGVARPGRPQDARSSRSDRVWESSLCFGGEQMGVLVVHIPDDAPPADAGWDRIMKAVAAQLSLFLHNVSERKKVRDMATQDLLTGLENYRSFQDNFAREFERVQRYARSLSLLMIDLDNFKQINDAFGHQVGDQVLREVGGILKRNLRKTDYAFRYGGDEFVVLMPERSSAQAEIFAQRVRSSVKREIRGIPPFEFSLSLSIGIADSSVLASKEKEELLQRADGALYQAKSRGRDRIQTAAAPPPESPGTRELHAV